MKRIFFITGLFLAVCLHLHAYNSLRILNPSQWGSDQGVIKKAEIFVQPNGLYVQYDLILEFSAQHTYFTNEDSLEVEMYFDLPEGAIVSDSWLLIGDSIVSADLIDRWTASTIYEGIVNRRKDPSVLYKNSDTNYELRIFPITKQENRVAGMTYLLPVQWDTKSIHAELPLQMLLTSMDEVPVDLYFPQNYNSKISIAGEPEETEPTDHDIFGPALKTSLKSHVFETDISITMDSPMNNGIYIDKAEYKGEGYYQLAVLPSVVVDFDISEKMVVLLDYDVSKTSFSKAEMVEQIKNQLHSYSVKDSFVLFYSDVTAKMLTNTWISCDSAAIEQAFDGLVEEVGNYSALPSLLTAGIEYVKNDKKGKIVLIGTSDQAGDYQIANAIIEDLKNITDTLPAFYIADAANYRVQSYYQGGKHYHGNEYLYIYLTRQTGGNLIQYIDKGSMLSTVSETFQSTSGLITSADLYTTLSDGFCYGRYFNVNVDKGIYMNQPLTQIGKYIGDFPFEITFSGVFNNQAFSVKKVISEDEVLQSDSVISKCWSGRFIDVLEKQSGTTETIHEIIKYSMDNRLLSRFTAFLALEPGMQIDIDESRDEDDDFLIDIEPIEVENKEVNISTYPNPFTDKLTVSFVIPKSIDSDQVTIRIYNMMGQVVKEMVVPAGYSGQKYTFVWDDTQRNGSVASGQYIIVVTGPGFSKSTNVVRK